MSFRGIVESPQFHEEANAICADVKRMDSALFAVTWALSRHPEHFEKVPGTKNLCRVLTDPFPDMPSLRIWYTFGEKEVTLLSIELAEEGETDAANA